MFFLHGLWSIEWDVPPARRGRHTTTLSIPNDLSYRMLESTVYVLKTLLHLFNFLSFYPILVFSEGLQRTLGEAHLEAPFVEGLTGSWGLV